MMTSAVTVTTTARRPELHFTPERNWVNDPNGLVFHKGVYHLFFQSNPYGNDWGNMSWGHAISRDLISWEDRPVAILFDDDGGIFSGSVVVDVTNSSGFGTPENPPLVAMYTIAQPGHQAQGLAFSVDDGETWTKYEGNPVLDRGTADFRDPKVVRYQDAGSQSYWVATCVEANDRQVLFFRSDDLKTWTPLSTFGPIGAVGGVWECPDLFPLRLDGGEEKWVLLVSINPGGIAGGSGTQYFVGDFDGVTFTPLEGEGDPHRWLDFGRDFYAGVTFDGVPDARRILIAWMSNWDYAAAVPTSPWRGGMALPRELTLETVDGRPQLRQSLVGGGPALDIVHTATAGALQEARTVLPVTGTTLVIDAVLHAGDASRFGLSVLGSADGTSGTTVVFDVSSGTVAVDRTSSGDTGFHPLFASVESAPVTLDDDRLTLRIVVDATSVEVFVNDGAVTITDLVFPNPDDTTVALLSEGGLASVASLTVARPS